MLSADGDDVYAFAVHNSVKSLAAPCLQAGKSFTGGRAELGYYIAEKYWGRGIMTEAVKQVCEYVFDKSDIIRIYAEPFANNTASCKVLEKAGFQCEGILRSNAVKNGKVMDMRMYALLKTEFHII